MSHLAATSHHLNQIDQIISQVDEVDSPEHRLRVASVAVAFASRTVAAADLARADALLDAASPMDRERFRIRYPLLRAQVYYHQRRVRNARALLEELCSSDYVHGPALQRVHVLLGLAACRATIGDYDGAVEPLQLAGLASARAGSPYYESHVVANLALIHLRRGAFLKAESYAERGYATYTNTRVDTGWLNEVGVRIVLAALRGDAQALDQRVRDGLTELAKQHSSASGSALRFWIADGLRLGGRHDESTWHAAHVLDHIREIPLGLVGRATRWAGVLQDSVGDRRYLHRIEAALAIIHQLDVLDQYEVASTALRHLSLCEEGRENLRLTMQAGAATLSSATVDYLRRAGLPVESALS